jgi:signal transduction histidine kinase
MKWIFTIWIGSIVMLVISGLATHSGKSIQATDISILQNSDPAASAADLSRLPFASFNKLTIPPGPGSTWVRIGIPQEIQSWEEPAVLFSGSTENVPSMHAFLERGLDIVDLGLCEKRRSSPSCAYPDLQYAFPVAPKDGHAILLKMDLSRSPAQSEFFFMTRPYYTRVNIFLTIYCGFCTGVGLFIAGLAINLYSITREKSVLYFGLYALLSFFAFFIYRGVWDSLYLPAVVSREIVYPSIAMAFVSEILFVRAFFDAPKAAPRIDFLFKVLILVWLGMILLEKSSYTTSLFWILAPKAVLLDSVFTLGVVVYFFLCRFKYSGLFLISWGTRTFGFLIWGISHQLYLHSPWPLGYAPMILRPLEMILFAFLIAQRIQSLSEEVGYARAKQHKNNVIQTLLRVLSHDFSNTTNAILFSAENAEGAADPAKAKECIRKIRTAAMAQVDVIRNARSSYLRSSGELNITPVDVSKTVDAALTILEPRIERKKIRVKKMYDTECPAALAEPTSLSNQVIANLLDNAIKFTPEGKSIYIRLHAHGLDKIVLEIADEGIGMPSDVKKRIFEDEARICRPGTEDETGTGTGLLVVRDFMTAFGAHVEVESKENAGTAFSLYFRRA